MFAARMFFIACFVVLYSLYASVINVYAAEIKNDEMEEEYDGPQLEVVNNYIFWCSYTYDKKTVKNEYINGIEGISNHGVTHELKAGGAISIYTGYLVLDDQKEKFQQSVAKCKKIPGGGLFKRLYQCENKIKGCIVTRSSEYIITYYKDPEKSNWTWDWATFRLILETFRLLEGTEYNALYRALYGKDSDDYKGKGLHGPVRVW